jgi:UDP-N-acetylmuramate dehydrogenase
MASIVRKVRIWSNEPHDARRRVRELSKDNCAFEYRDSRFKQTGEVVLEAWLELALGDGEEITAAVAANQAQRRATQPLAEQNAGSVFRNPPGDFAGRLIDDAGLKGFRIGSAAVSTLHANFIVVDRGGRAADVRALGDHVRSVVAEQFGVELAYEIEFVGEWPAGLAPLPTSLSGTR